jgi:hypothetical protein
MRRAPLSTPSFQKRLGYAVWVSKGSHQSSDPLLPGPSRDRDPAEPPGTPSEPIEARCRYLGHSGCRRTRLCYVAIRGQGGDRPAVNEGDPRSVWRPCRPVVVAFAGDLSQDRSVGVDDEDLAGAIQVPGPEGKPGAVGRPDEAVSTAGKWGDFFAAGAVRADEGENRCWWTYAALSRTKSHPAIREPSGDHAAAPRPPQSSSAISLRGHRRPCGRGSPPSASPTPKRFSTFHLITRNDATAHHLLSLPRANALDNQPSEHPQQPSALAYAAWSWIHSRVAAAR